MQLKKKELHYVTAECGRMALDDGPFMLELLNCVCFATGGFVLANWIK